LKQYWEFIFVTFPIIQKGFTFRFSRGSWKYVFVGDCPGWSVLRKFPAQTDVSDSGAGDSFSGYSGISLLFVNNESAISRASRLIAFVAFAVG
jgi:hypothetical protein